MHYLFREQKEALKLALYSSTYNFQKMPKESNRSMGENSPNLVTLSAADVVVSSISAICSASALRANDAAVRSDALSRSKLERSYRAQTSEFRTNVSDKILGQKH
jgi:hypothetical protein